MATAKLSRGKSGVPVLEYGLLKAHGAPSYQDRGMLGIANAVRVGMPRDVTGKKCGARENVAVLRDGICGVL